VNPFKVVYSGALPAQLQLNSMVLRPEKNRASGPLASDTELHSGQPASHRKVVALQNRSPCKLVVVNNNSPVQFFISFHIYLNLFDYNLFCAFMELWNFLLRVGVVILSDCVNQAFMMTLAFIH